MCDSAEIVVRSSVAVRELGAARAFSGAFVGDERILADGWRIARVGDWPDFIAETLAEVAAETARPVLFAVEGDDGSEGDAFVQVAVHLPSEPLTFNAWLGADAAAAAGNDLEGYDEAAAHQLLVVWSQEAGLRPDTATLAIALGRAELSVDELLRTLLVGVGVLPGVDARDVLKRFAHRESKRAAVAEFALDVLLSFRP